MIKKITDFFRGSLEELKKVTWPSKEEGVRSAIIVIFFVTIFALFLSFVDVIINALVIWMVK